MESIRGCFSWLSYKWHGIGFISNGSFYWPTRPTERVSRDLGQNPTQNTHPKPHSRSRIPRQRQLWKESLYSLLVKVYLEDHPLSKWLVTPIYKPFGPFGRGTTRSLGDVPTMVINHLQVVGWSSKLGYVPVEYLESTFKSPESPKWCIFGKISYKEAKPNA